MRLDFTITSLTKAIRIYQVHTFLLLIKSHKYLGINTEMSLENRICNKYESIRDARANLQTIKIYALRAQLIYSPAKKKNKIVNEIPEPHSTR